MVTPLQGHQFVLAGEMTFLKKVLLQENIPLKCFHENHLMTSVRCFMHIYST